MGRPAPKPQAKTGRSFPLLTGPAIVLATAIITVGAAGLVYLLSGAPRETKSSASPVATSQSRASAAVPARNFQALKGRWLRPDGGYVIELRDVDATGKLNAAYFNPQPIKVSRAEASRDGGMFKVFIELRDVGYPGSTYTLTYDPATDQLKGDYYQAAMRQTFDVGFVRLK